LIISQLTLHNWQPYYGRGKKALTLNFKGKSGQKNSIFYGQNTHGKSAIWQAIQFAMYGRVNKRKTGWQDGKYKPYVAKNTGQEPLLNLPAYKRKDFVFGINLKFNHGGDEYELDRTVEPRTGVSIPKRNSEMEPRLTLKNLTTAAYIKQPQNFLNKILPENLAQFFMFDGERLNGYRELFEDTKSVELKSYIEHVLRLPVLTDGVTDFTKILSKKQKKKSSILLEDDDNQKLKKDVEAFEKERDQYQKIVDSRTTKIEQDEEELRQVKVWLNDNGTVKDAYQEFEKFDEKVDELNDQIEKLNLNFRKSVPGTWRAILSDKINNKIEEISSKLGSQKRAGETIGELKEQIKKNKNLIDGENCKACDQPLPKPTLENLELYSKQITEWKKEITELKKEQVTPDPFELLTKLNKLQKVELERDLQFLVDYENDLLKLEHKITKTRSLRDTAKDKLKSDSIAKTKSMILKEEELSNGINKSKGKLEQDQQLVDDMNSDIKKLTKDIPETKATDSVQYQQVDKSTEILQELVNILEDEAVVHREKVREKVEKHATTIFLSISTLAEEFSKVQIDHTFKVDLLDVDGEPDGGSSGQSALMAYSVIDALTVVSGIEFPFIVDTPATSIDDENLDNLFEFLLNKSKRQILILPEGKEMKPDIGDKKYGHTCAMTFEIEKLEKQKMSLLHERVNNC
jgi:DNA sulfur modification protein DndD